MRFFLLESFFRQRRVKAAPFAQASRVALLVAALFVVSVLGLTVVPATGFAAPGSAAQPGQAAVADKNTGEAPGSIKEVIVIVPVRSIILQGTEEQFNRALALALERKAAAIVIELDTPGGVLQTTQAITQAIFKSPIPVIVYVTPTGASATSAGVFITVAAHVASMAPGTSIGAAHPVESDGKDIAGDMRKKAENATVSMARGLAQERGRNADWVERAVRESISVTVTEAVKEKVVDFEAASLDDVLRRINGRTVQLQNESGTPRSIELKDLSAATRVVVEPNTREAVINFLGHPNIAALLWLAATTGLSIELYNPGAVLPGVVGVISLVLALAVSQIVPLNDAALLLFVAGAAMIGLEFVLPSFVLGIGGIAAMVAGALYLIDSQAAPGLAVSGPVIAPTAVLLGGLMLLTVVVAARAAKRRVTSGVEGLVGREFVLEKAMTKKGTVNLEGEIWRVELEDTSPETLAAGSRMVVVRVKGLTLIAKAIA